MLKTIKTLIAVAALSGTVGANVQAKDNTVEKGNSLWELSQGHNASIENIKNWNKLSIDFIHPGEILKIATKKHYTAKQGDTIFSIANENKVSVQELIAWNDLYTNLIHPGKDLVIYDDSAAPNPMVSGNKVELKLSEDRASHTTVVPKTLEVTQTTEKQTESEPVNNQQEATTKAVNESAASGPETDSASAPEISPTPAPEPQPATESSPTPAPEPQPAPESSPAPASEASQAESASAPAASPSDSSKEITVKATAYTASCEGCSGITKTGVDLKANPDEKVIAVDPSVIPLGSKVYIEGYGEATAADTGGAIKGNRIDIYMKNESDALQFGAKNLTVKILN